MSLETRVAQMMGGYNEEQYDCISPALYPSTTYERCVDTSYPKGKCYSRDQNPTLSPAETALCELEGGAEALLFASGMAAATAVFQAMRPGDVIVVPDVMYWGLRNWVKSFAQSWGISLHLVSMLGDASEIRRALQEGKEAQGGKGRNMLVWVETPANPTWGVTDLELVALIAAEFGALVAVDSTAATPVLTQPIRWGAHMVMHSATKYLNGHSDVLAGGLVVSEQARAGEMWARIKDTRKNCGSMLGAFDAWLLQRGMRTLFLRVKRQCDTAMQIALHFQGSPDVTVLYPGLPSHPGHSVACKQMQGGFGGMLSLRIRGGQQSALDFAARLKVFKRATSLGGVESLVEHRASIEGKDSPVPDDLLRVSVGIEDPRDLIQDLDDAAKMIGK